MVDAGAGSEMALDFDQLKLMEDELQWYSDLPVTNPRVPLVFVNDPSACGQFRWPSQAELVQYNVGLHALKAGRHANSAFLATESRYCEMLTVLQSKERSDRIVALAKLIHIELARLNREKELQWTQQRGEYVVGMVLVNTGGYEDSLHYCVNNMSVEIHFFSHGPRDPVSKAASVISLVLENIYFTPRRALRTTLAGVRDLLCLTNSLHEGTGMIPKDPRSCATQFRLDPVTCQYISCPTCHCLYTYNPGDSPDSLLHPAITHCTHQKTPQSTECGTNLWKVIEVGPRKRYAPRRKYLHQVLKHWVGRLLSRRGIEDHLDAPPHNTPHDDDAPIHDIWLSKVFQALRDSAGRPFLPPPPGEGRLVFSLSVDGFNPYFNKAAGVVETTTGIWLVVLNLPPHLRHLPENVCFLGAIPGKPSMEQINHYLKLVVDDLLEFWIPGVFFSRTYKYRAGRTFHGMLVPFVADMLAARQVVGQPISTTSHHFCTSCDLDYDDIDVLDPAEWLAKNADHMRWFASLWKEAPNEQQQSDIFEATGIRWSALLDLPYWDPVRYTVIDSMHALDLGLLERHCRKFFKLNPEVPGGDGSPVKSGAAKKARLKARPTQKDLDSCLELIKRNEDTMAFRLLSFPRVVLYTICMDYGILGEGFSMVVGTKWVLAQNIHHWV